ncbi:MAG: putative Ig domain-containing protein, partial [Congregibacter sp.]
TITRVNDDPTIATPLLDQGATAEAAFSFTVPGGTFADADAGDTLTLSAQLAGGGALPSWLTFTAGTGAFDGTPGPGDVGSISIDVIAGDGNGGTAAVDTFNIAVGSAVVTNQPPSGEVLISTSTPTEGDSLSASNTLSDPNGIATPISYQWQRDGSNIDGATESNYIATAIDVGSRISVVASFTDGDGNIETVSSAASSPVVGLGNRVPAGDVIITGVASEDEVLTASNTLVDADGISGSLSYQWQRDGVDIVGATGDTLMLEQQDVNSVMSVLANYTDDRGTIESVASDGIGPVANVNDRVQGTPTIVGLAETGELLTANTSQITDEDGIASVELQWERSTDAGDTWVTVGTGMQYRVDDADEGGQIRLSAVVLDSFSTEAQVFSDTVIVEQGVAPIEIIVGVVESQQSTEEDDDPAADQDTDGNAVTDGGPRDLPVSGGGFGGDGTGDDGIGGGGSDAVIGQATVIEDSFTDIRYSGTTVLERAALAEQEVAQNVAPDVAPDVVVYDLLDPAAVPQVAPGFQLPEPPDLPERRLPDPARLTELTSISPSMQEELELEHVDAVTRNYSMWKDIDEMKQAIDDSAQFEEEFVVRVVSGSGLGVAAAFAAYTLRGGALLASLLGSIPVWAAYDPLPILSRDKRAKLGADKDNKTRDDAAAGEDGVGSDPNEAEALF